MPCNFNKTLPITFTSLVLGTVSLHSSDLLAYVHNLNLDRIDVVAVQSDSTGLVTIPADELQLVEGDYYSIKLVKDHNQDTEGVVPLTIGFQVTDCVGLRFERRNQGTFTSIKL